LANHEKKINLSNKDHQQRVRDLLYSKGIDDENFIVQLLNKTRNVVNEQKLEIKKDK